MLLSLIQMQFGSHHKADVLNNFNNIELLHMVSGISRQLQTLYMYIHDLIIMCLITMYVF